MSSLTVLFVKWECSYISMRSEYLSRRQTEEGLEYRHRSQHVWLLVNRTPSLRVTGEKRNVQVVKAAIAF